MVWFLLQHAPRHFHMVLTSREEPSLPLGSLHASGELLEIDVGELRFSLEETRRSFGSLEQVQSSEAELNELQRESGGWPAALRITSSSLRAGVTGAQCLRSRLGSSHAVEAYLSEILLRLPADVYDFVLAGSVLKAMSPEICNELMGIDNGDEMIELLFHHYQFVNPETKEPGAYCYHPLIAEYLQRRLKRETPHKLTDLHRKAAGWYARNDRIVEAIEHAVGANDCEVAAVWTEQCAMRLIKEGKVRMALSWRRWLPRELMRKHLSLRLALAWSMVLAAERDDALAWIDEIEADIAAGTPDPEGRAAREVLGIRTAVVGLSDNADAARELGERYMQHPLEDPWINNAVGNCLLFAHIMTGRHEEVDRMPWYPMAPGSYVRASSAQIYRLCLTGLSCSQRMKFREADAYFQQATEIANRDRGAKSSLAAIPAVLHAHQLYELDQIDAAEALLVNRLDAINATGFLDCALRAYTVLVRIAYRKKDNTLAYRLLDMGDVVAATERWPRMQAALLVERMRLFLSEDRLEAAEGCLSSLEALAASEHESRRVVPIHICAYLQFARAFLQFRRSPCAEAAELLEPTWNGLASRRNAYWAARVGMLQAVIWFSADCTDRAFARFDEVLESVVPAGLVRTIVDTAPEVGALIAAGQSNKRIAQLLSVSPETVKSHIKNILLKLEVDNWMLAVSRGRRLRLFA